MGNCCCESHSDEASYKIYGEGVRGNSDKGNPTVSRCCQVHRKNRSKIWIAWTIFKLKCVSAAFRPLIRIHIWSVLRAQKKLSDDTINTGTAKPKQGQEDI